MIIGNDVWIGCNSVILRGVTIGDGAVIGASSVITKDVPAYSVVVGNPGKVIKYRFAKEIIDKLQSMKWWNWSSSFIQDNIKIFQEDCITLSVLNDLEKRYNLFICKDKETVNE